VSEEQKRDWGDLLGLIISPQQSRNLSVWPSVPSDFRQIVDAYNMEIKILALVINIGYLLEVMTNGRYKSIQHRAVTNKDKSRLSNAVFYSPGFDAEIGPAPELIDESHPCLFRKFIHEDHIKYYMSHKQEGKTSFYEYAGV